MTSNWPPEECDSVTRETVLDGVPRVSSGFQTPPRTRAYRPSVRNELTGLSVLLRATDQNPNGGIKNLLDYSTISKRVWKKIAEFAASNINCLASISK
ncbi:hypothetical protein ABIF44_003104 [Bradyrhizobium japonicum]|jgi:hypothetical protein|nr:hypothetical protein [Bradyrhizobium japonicum]MCS3990593.1 hypothetical protein [Bradyrhizobium japonicum]MCS4014593.1 hypothetical protein [Bradyrhizobium japonicum]MCS4210602.1 hypothetical protein [Bradyrhizobium japonicum]MDH6178409.1 hypothetical protein [Bradyrhizobium japonicum]